ncbi:MAG: coproporphyrinogen dehydrogenase HemZ [Lachnospiraceae bacterium]|nr:coproporphyrinogen dehydrogenase HemZ [Lachnospiraceae bacterium]
MYVELNSKGFTYDVHSLVKAFYPGEDVIVNDPGEGEEVSIRVEVFPEEAGDSVRTSGHVRVWTCIGGAEEELTGDYEDCDRPAVKSHLKRCLYGLLSKVTRKDLPWGTMTGIRPTKVPMKLIREGADDEAISAHMRSVYLCSDEKIKLAKDIAHNEAAIMDGLSGDGFSLYIGIPFCPTRCLYCSFTSYPIGLWKDRTGDYLKALGSELDLLSGIFAGRRADSIYIGGGTPTTLSDKELYELIKGLGERFDLSALRELTVEAGRPDSITEEKLAALAVAGVSRISINPQTMNAKTLDLIGRRHSVDDVYRAFEMARTAGFTNINTDLILGLPGEDEGDVRHTFDCIKDLAPDSLTVHCMALKRAAGMHEYLTEHKEIRSVVTAGMLDAAAECATDLGMVPYYLYRQKNIAGNFENVGYARRDCFGVYNIVMMEEVSDIGAAGAGTISKRVFPDGRIERCDTVKDVDLYMKRIGEMKERKKKLFE